MTTNNLGLTTLFEVFLQTAIVPCYWFMSPGHEELWWRFNINQTLHLDSGSLHIHITYIMISRYPSLIWVIFFDIYIYIYIQWSIDNVKLLTWHMSVLHIPCNGWDSCISHHLFTHSKGLYTQPHIRCPFESDGHDLLTSFHIFRSINSLALSEFEENCVSNFKLISVTDDSAKLLPWYYDRTSVLV